MCHSTFFFCFNLQVDHLPLRLVLQLFVSFWISKHCVGFRGVGHLALLLLEIGFKLGQFTLEKPEVGYPILLGLMIVKALRIGLKVYHLPPASSVASEQDELPSSVELDSRAR
ncbi:hypothetical protein Tco_0653923 [Tanacetum coccineum]|uniref:Uncharacterized protein n=1 Tax=Tanacetum coccineum TaxID=301880 RepID=A0ABQ4X1X2_9ASTR